MTPRPLGTTTIAVLRAVSDRVAFGFDIIDHTGLPSGTVYPALASLQRRGLVRSNWEDRELAHSQARPRRRYYRITEEGETILAQALEKLKRMGLPTPAQNPPSHPSPAGRSCSPSAARTVGPTPRRSTREHLRSDRRCACTRRSACPSSHTSRIHLMMPVLPPTDAPGAGGRRCPIGRRSPCGLHPG